MFYCSKCNLHLDTFLQDTRPLGLIPLINLVLERKKKKVVVCVLQLQVIIDIVFQIIELLNKETSSLIKVNKPNKKAVQSELSLLQLLV